MHFVYLLINSDKKRKISYVGYTNNLKKRLLLHNTSKGAKFTRGRQWKMIFHKQFINKNIALKYEYKLKKNYYLRNKIKNKYFLSNETI
jgi:putative endonuclease